MDQTFGPQKSPKCPVTSLGGGDLEPATRALSPGSESSRVGAGLTGRPHSSADAPALRRRPDPPPSGSRVGPVCAPVLGPRLLCSCGPQGRLSVSRGPFGALLPSRPLSKPKSPRETRDVEHPSEGQGRGFERTVPERLKPQGLESHPTRRGRGRRGRREREQGGLLSSVGPVTSAGPRL